MSLVDISVKHSHNWQCKLTAVIRRQTCSVAVVPNLRSSGPMKILGLATLYQLDIFYSKPHPTITRDLLIDPSMHFFFKLEIRVSDGVKKTNYTE